MKFIFVYLQSLCLISKRETSSKEVFNSERKTWSKTKLLSGYFLFILNINMSSSFYLSVMNQRLFYSVKYRQITLKFKTLINMAEKKSLMLIQILLLYMDLFSLGVFFEHNSNFFLKLLRC